MGRWGLGRVIRGREGLPTTWVHPDFFPGALAFQLPDPGVPTKRKVQGKGCQGREAPHRKVRDQGPSLGKQSLSPTQASANSTVDTS